MSLSAAQQAELLRLQHTLDVRFARIREALAAATLASLDAERITGAHLHAETAQPVRDYIEMMLTELDHWAFAMIPRLRKYAESQIEGIDALLLPNSNMVPGLEDALLDERAAWTTVRNRCVEWSRDE